MVMIGPLWGREREEWPCDGEQLSNDDKQHFPGFSFFHVSVSDIKLTNSHNVHARSPYVAYARVCEYVMLYIKLQY